MRLRKNVAVVCLTLVLPALASGEVAQTHISGSNTLRLDHYGAGGDPAVSSYVNTGYHWYDDLDLTASHYESDFNKFEFRLNATNNQSAYHAPDLGTTVNSGSIQWERGDTAIPFRAQAGDYFAYLSPRTLQRNLKGAMLEIQPETKGEVNHSLQLFGGRSATDYRDIDLDNDDFYGLSWVIEGTEAGDFSVVAVRLDSDGATSFTPRQGVYSLAWSKELQLTSQNLKFEAEIAKSNSDIWNDTDGQYNPEAGFGYFTGITGQLNETQFSYGLTHERYSEHFRPAGGSVSSNQEQQNTFVNWGRDSGEQYDLRFNRMVSELESGNPTTTLLWQGSYSQPLEVVATGANLSLNFTHQTYGDQNQTYDERSIDGSVGLSLPLSDLLSARGELGQRKTSDRITNDESSVRHATLGFDWSLAFGSFQGSVSPGITMRRNDRNGDRSDDYNGSLVLNLSSARHSIYLSYNGARQQGRYVGSMDMEDDRFGLEYSYQKDEHQLGLSAEYGERRPTPGLESYDSRVGLFWTWNFDSSNDDGSGYSSRPAAPVYFSNSKRPPPLNVPGLRLDLRQLQPGMTRDETEKLLAANQITHPLVQGERAIYNVRLLPGIAQRQQLILDFDGPWLKRSGLTVNFSNPADPVRSEQEYQKLQQQVIGLYGAPDSVLERGRFDGADGQLLRREIEWATANTKIRLGIPRRMGGERRMEWVIAEELPTLVYNGWGIGPR